MDLFATIGTFLDQVRGVMALDPATIQALLTSPSGLQTAVVILLLGCLSAAIGDSPVLFANRVPPGRFVTALLVETGLSLLQVVVWIASLWVLVRLLFGVPASLADAVRVVGIGYAPMLFGFLGLIPVFGPPITRILRVWTFVAIIAALSISAGLTLGQALVCSAFGWLATLLFRKTVDRLLVRLFGSVSRRALGVDVMARTEQLDLFGQISARAAEGARSLNP